MILRIVILCVFLSFFPYCSHAAVYGYIDEGGTYHFTNMIPIGKKFRVIISDTIKSIVVKNIDNSSYDNMIMQHATTHGIDPLLVKAVMKTESNFNPRALSHKGAQGLMQLMPDTARFMNVFDPFDPDDNIKGGTRYLKYLDEIFGGNLELMLAAYNAGPGRVIEYKMNVPPYEETKIYIQRVKAYYNKLKKPNES
jgi:soluble lytic murein transglycosylase-like protein